MWSKGKRSRNKASVGEPADGSLRLFFLKKKNIYIYTLYIYAKQAQVFFLFFFFLYNQYNIYVIIFTIYNIIYYNNLEKFLYIQINWLSDGSLGSLHR